ncbi:hypothetical protein BO79DRAFT_80573 [Aspergillus costaricaensis CBS 115574]|uniref:Uncharacterized protein n=1 Tax=Aspergillus costaricaensis CBS 115574 TaxID=1448317 RepID=A0ACD1IL61_9EURO|nr:hypothetical protein BO79DRAFT_80573 [Aspergillus costaricaensis CBS 115574]RAK91311.1 hypothetical protein BO79DRAFT_80573 [Aspergillus costaricaensis CBS 115574]
MWLSSLRVVNVDSLFSHSRKAPLRFPSFSLSLSLSLFLFSSSLLTHSLTLLISGISFASSSQARLLKTRASFPGLSCFSFTFSLFHPIFRSFLSLSPSFPVTAALLIEIHLIPVIYPTTIAILSIIPSTPTLTSLSLSLLLLLLLLLLLFTTSTWTTNN